jgi:hypothetical protein
VINISVWKDADGYITNTYYVPADQSYEPKLGMAGDVAHKLANGREHVFAEVWKEVRPMVEPTK